MAPDLHNESLGGGVNQFTLHLGDCIAVMRTMADNSVDAIVTDPPYHLTTGKKGGSGPASLHASTSPFGRASQMNLGGERGFMGMKWDGGDIAQSVEMWSEALRVLRPGGHLLAFAGSRTYHRMVVAMEDSGFEIRDQLMWLYGSGMPKSRNIAKYDLDGDDAAKWDGWGSGLKPSHEPICMARKPMIGTLAANVLAYGTGAINIDGCRVPFSSDADADESKTKNAHADFGSGARKNAVFGQDNRPRGANGNYDPPGRWPANVIHDGSDEVVQAFPQSSITGMRSSDSKAATVAGTAWLADNHQSIEHTDSGSAARFFYAAKASKKDRNDGCADGANIHPTVKPVSLMQYLVRLVTPPGGIVLDPFMGSGSTGKACMAEGFAFIGIELSPDYLAIAKARIGHAGQPAAVALQPDLFAVAPC